MTIACYAAATMNHRHIPSVVRLALAASIAVSCGTRADYEMQYLRQLVARGDSAGALEQAGRLTPLVRQTPEVAMLLVGVQLTDLGLEINALAGLLEQTLSSPAKIFERLPSSTISKEKLRRLHAEILTARSRATAHVLPSGFELVCNAGELFASLMLAKSHAPDGWTMTHNALEEISSGADPLVFASAAAAQNLLDSIDHEADPSSELARIFSGPKVSKTPSNE